MKVLLLADVRGTGRKGDVKEVREGYARNFLIPRNLAEVATEKTLQEKEIRDAAAEGRRATQRREAERAAGELTTLTLKFPVKAGEEGQVYSSVTAHEIESALDAHGYHGCRVNLEKPLKTLGMHQVTVGLHGGTKTTVSVTVVPRT